MKIGVLLADAFQDSEYFLPKFEIESAGAQTEVISVASKPIEIECCALMICRSMPSFWRSPTLRPFASTIRRAEM